MGQNKEHNTIKLTCQTQRVCWGSPRTGAPCVAEGKWWQCKVGRPARLREERTLDYRLEVHNDLKTKGFVYISNVAVVFVILLPYTIVILNIKLQYLIQYYDWRLLSLPISCNKSQGNRVLSKQYIKCIKDYLLSLLTQYFLWVSKVI